MMVITPLLFLMMMTMAYEKLLIINNKSDGIKLMKNSEDIKYTAPDIRYNYLQEKKSIKHCQLTMAITNVTVKKVREVFNHT